MRLFILLLWQADILQPCIVPLLVFGRQKSFRGFLKCPNSLLKGVLSQFGTLEGYNVRQFNKGSDKYLLIQRLQIRQNVD